MQILLDLLAGFFFLGFGSYGYCLARQAWHRGAIETGVQVQSSSGDSEVMVFNLNFTHNESEDSKQAKIQDAWDRIQERRDENHEKWLKKKAEAIEKNEKLSPEDLKMQRLSESRVVEASEDTH